MYIPHFQLIFILISDKIKKLFKMTKTEINQKILEIMDIDSLEPFDSKLFKIK